MSLWPPDFCEIKSVDDFVNSDPDTGRIGVVSSFVAIGSLVMILVLGEICWDGLEDFKLSESRPRVMVIMKIGKWSGF